METSNQIKTANQILNDAADFLEHSNRWHKGSFFKANESDPDQGCSMCAHGAIMYCSSDLIKQKADNNAATTAFAAASVATATAAAVATTANRASLEGLSILEYLREHYGEVAAAHCKANLVGLKYEYNDAPNITKQDVINKLREAAKL